MHTGNMYACTCTHTLVGTHVSRHAHTHAQRPPPNKASHGLCVPQGGVIVTAPTRSLWLNAGTLKPACMHACMHRSIHACTHATIHEHLELRFVPQAKVIFTAPTRPLVRQQFQAICEAVGFPKVGKAPITAQHPASTAQHSTRPAQLQSLH